MSSTLDPSGQPQRTDSSRTGCVIETAAAAAIAARGARLRVLERAVGLGAADRRCRSRDDHGA